MRGATLYAVYDIIAEEYIGTLTTARADAAAVRLFSDLAADDRTIVGKHPKDFSLVALGHIDNDNTLIGYEPKTIVTGEAWLASQRPAGPTLEKEA